MSRVYMIRHGKPASTWGQSSDLDPGLDELGDEQARGARDVLLAAAHPPTRIVSSPLRRCRETAAPLAVAMGLQVEIDPAFGEIPTPAHLTLEERPAWLRKAFGGRWSEITGDLDYEVWRRAVAQALWKYPGAAVFSHYVAINAAVSCVTGSDQVLGFRPDHCSITTFDVSDRGELSLVGRGREAETQVL
jgi:broad specificity phosphatase PhoE